MAGNCNNKVPLKYGAVVHYYNDVRFVQTVIANIRTLLASKSITEVLIWDDGSDHGKEFPLEFLPSDTRIKLFRHPENVGIYAARLAAIASIKSNYIWMIDSDDSVIQVPEIFPGYDIYCFDFLGTHIVNDSSYKYEHGLISSLRSDVLTDKVSCVVWNKIIKKSLLDGLGDYLFRNGDDLYIMLHALSKTAEVCYEKMAIINYLIRSDSLSRGSRSGRLYDLALVIKKLRSESKINWLEAHSLWWNYILRNFLRSVLRQGNPPINESIDLARSLKCLF